ncbi:hypothetical protein [Streptomyces aurantiacus]|uniref:hypothetical protein n=1 Tax=Streptomyces aurantiacus TaxID=47760 RepID=UPI0027D83831|nr:hypothetical protein [Streptomyces aurantiacus]
MLQGGADEINASLWPLSVDGLLLLATVGLLKPTAPRTRRSRCRRRRSCWLTGLLGTAGDLQPEWHVLLLWATAHGMIALQVHDQGKARRCY